MKVLLTRPSEDAISTSNYLKKLSIESCIVPLLKIKKLDTKKLMVIGMIFFVYKQEWSEKL